MPDNKIVPFLFDGEITVRVIDRGDALTFVAADVCRALGVTNASDAVRSLDEDEKGIGSIDTLGGYQEVVVVTESGLYALIFKSRKPNAVKFRKWVTAEVLPSIRRTGSYSVAAATETPIAARKPWPEWSLEERRVALSEVNTARRVFNQATAVWMWEKLGLPVPPAYLLPAWWQADLHLSGSN